MTVIGYADRFSAKPGESFRFMVSAEADSFEASLVRFHGSLWPARPIAPEVVESSFDGAYRGRVQAVPIGSYVHAGGLDQNSLANGLTFTAWINPRLPLAGHEQGIITTADEEHSGFSLGIDERGCLVFAVGGDGRLRVETREPLVADRWYFVAARWDAQTGRGDLTCLMVRRAWLSARRLDVDRSGSSTSVNPSRTLVMGCAGLNRLGEGRFAPAGSYNGKLDRPSVWGRRLTDEELDAVRDGADPLSMDQALLAAWDFTQGMEGSAVIDRSANGRHGACVNHPMRAVVGANWTGHEVSPTVSPNEYGAIAFHEDDLTDCEWDADFAFTVPADLGPGVYATRLETSDAVDHVPFYVRRATDAAAAPVLFLAPTNTYLAYGNERLFQGIESDPDFVEKTVREPVSLTERDHFLMEHPELGASVYDLHPDKSGICYSSRLRPVVTMRPEMVAWTTGHPRHFSGDLFLIEWLERMGYAYDVATDEDLHLEGAGLLRDYAVVITGGHPEYWTEPMMNALESYLSGGGRFMYLGGNGFYWVTGINPEQPHTIEVRRGLNGTRAWTSHPGEVHLSTTGEHGGMWRNRGRFPNRLAGVGFAAQGWGGAPGFHRLPDSFDPEAAFIFEGVGEDEIIGEFGLIMGGAAGDEIDRYDESLGTPAETLRLATTEGLHSDYYQLVIEDCAFMLSGRGGSEEPRVRADLTYLADSNGGAVFSVGSINWIGSLMWNDGDNNVSRITGNVVDRFISR
ncbi:large subunit of N,N-dimethylformamidase [soil metagenome]